MLSVSSPSTLRGKKKVEGKKKRAAETETSTRYVRPRDFVAFTTMKEEEDSLVLRQRRMASIAAASGGGGGAWHRDGRAHSSQRPPHHHQEGEEQREKDGDPVVESSFTSLHTISIPSHSHTTRTSMASTPTGRLSHGTFPLVAHPTPPPPLPAPAMGKCFVGRVVRLVEEEEAQAEEHPRTEASLRPHEKEREAGRKAEIELFFETEMNEKEEEDDDEEDEEPEEKTAHTDGGEEGVKEVGGEDLSPLPTGTARITGRRLASGAGPSSVSFPLVLHPLRSRDRSDRRTTDGDEGAERLGASTDVDAEEANAALTVDDVNEISQRRAELEQDMYVSRTRKEWIAQRIGERREDRLACRRAVQRGLHGKSKDLLLAYGMIAAVTGKEWAGLEEEGKTEAEEVETKTWENLPSFYGVGRDHQGANGVTKEGTDVPLLTARTFQRAYITEKEKVEQEITVRRSRALFLLEVVGALLGEEKIRSLCRSLPASSLGKPRGMMVPPSSSTGEKDGDDPTAAKRKDALEAFPMPLHRCVMLLAPQLPTLLTCFDLHQRFFANPSCTEKNDTDEHSKKSTTDAATGHEGWAPSAAAALQLALQCIAAFEEEVDETTTGEDESDGGSSRNPSGHATACSPSSPYLFVSTTSPICRALFYWVKAVVSAVQAHQRALLIERILTSTCSSSTIAAAWRIAEGDEEEIEKQLQASGVEPGEGKRMDFSSSRSFSEDEFAEFDEDDLDDTQLHKEAEEHEAYLQLASVELEEIEQLLEDLIQVTQQQQRQQQRQALAREAEPSEVETREEEVEGKSEEEENEQGEPSEKKKKKWRRTRLLVSMEHIFFIFPTTEGTDPSKEKGGLTADHTTSTRNREENAVPDHHEGEEEEEEEVLPEWLLLWQPPTSSSSSSSSPSPAEGGVTRETSLQKEKKDDENDDGGEDFQEGSEPLPTPPPPPSIVPSLHLPSPFSSVSSSPPSMMGVASSCYLPPALADALRKAFQDRPCRLIVVMMAIPPPPRTTGGDPSGVTSSMSSSSSLSTFFSSLQGSSGATPPPLFTTEGGSRVGMKTVVMSVAAAERWKTQVEVKRVTAAIALHSSVVPIVPFEHGGGGTTGAGPQRMATTTTTTFIPSLSFGGGGEEEHASRVVLPPLSFASTSDGEGRPGMEGVSSPHPAPPHVSGAFGSGTTATASASPPSLLLSARLGIQNVRSRFDRLQKTPRLTTARVGAGGGTGSGGSTLHALPLAAGSGTTTTAMRAMWTSRLGGSDGGRLTARAALPPVPLTSRTGGTTPRIAKLTGLPPSVDTTVVATGEGKGSRPLTACGGWRSGLGVATATRPAPTAAAASSPSTQQLQVVVGLLEKELAAYSSELAAVKQERDQLLRDRKGNAGGGAGGGEPSSSRTRGMEKGKKGRDGEKDHEGHEGGEEGEGEQEGDGQQRRGGGGDSPTTTSTSTATFRVPPASAIASMVTLYGAGTSEQQQQLFRDLTQDYRQALQAIQNLKQDVESSRAVQEELEDHLRVAMETIGRVEEEKGHLQEMVEHVEHPHGNTQGGGAHAVPPNARRTSPFLESSETASGRGGGAGPRGRETDLSSPSAALPRSQEIELTVLQEKLKREESKREMTEGKLNQALRAEREAKEEIQSVRAERDKLWQQLEEAQNKLEVVQTAEGAGGGAGGAGSQGMGGARRGSELGLSYPSTTTIGNTTQTGSSGRATGASGGGGGAGGMLTFAGLGNAEGGRTTPYPSNGAAFPSSPSASSAVPWEPTAEDSVLLGGGGMGTTTSIMHHLPVEKLSVRQLRYAVHHLRRELTDSIASMNRRALDLESENKMLKDLRKQAARAKQIRSQAVENLHKTTMLSFMQIQKEEQAKRECMEQSGRDIKELMNNCTREWFNRESFS